MRGGSYLDLGIIFGTGSTHLYAIFHQEVLNWICDDRLVDISGVEYCKDEGRMNAVARDFADGSNHLFSGCIGAVDGGMDCLGFVCLGRQPGEKLCMLTHLLIKFFCKLIQR